MYNLNLVAKPAFVALGAFFLCCLLASCQKGETIPDDATPGDPPLVASSPLLRLVPPSESGIDFQNAIVETFENNITTNINIYNGGGVGIADFNNDNLPDIYFVSSTGKNKLYQNLGKMKFKDISETAGVESDGGFETAVTVVDINTDGFADLYVCRAGPTENDARRNRLFVNNGNLTFTEKAKEYGLDDISASSGANFFDSDADGDLDLYLLNYPTDFSYCTRVDVRPNAAGNGVEPNLSPKTPYDTDRFYRNDGGKFTDVSKAAGIWNFAYGLSVSVADFNWDGRPDVYVGNDFIQPDLLYINNGDGSFTNRLGDFFQHSSQHTMGTELADFDNDGLLDLFACDMLSNDNYRQKTVMNVNTQSQYSTLVQYGYFEPVVRNVLQRNNGPAAPKGHAFSDLAGLSGVYKTDWSWSGLFADLDNDGWKDLCVTNGYRRETGDLDFISFTIPEIKKQDVPLPQQYKNVYDFLNLIPSYKLRNFVFRNKGDWSFENKTGDWFTAKASWSNGAAYGDLDGDGDLDYIVNNLEEPAFLYENKAADEKKGNFLQVKLKGSTANPLAVGASVSIYYGNQLQHLEMSPTRGIFSSVEHLLHFGLGNLGQVDKLVVRWPDGKAQTLTNVKANQRLTLSYTDANETVPPRPAPPTPVFRDLTASTGVAFRHVENEFNDFESHFLQPWKLSELGPNLATADVNGDGLVDVFVGNSFNHPAGLFVQGPAGKFKRSSDNKAWEQDQLYEDHGACFFDADGDSDPDLFVVSGGAEATTPEAWQHRFYINDGKGSFRRVNAIPTTKNAGSRAVAHDYDGDGDLDLFVGGRADLGTYPAAPQSYVLRNERTHFVDATKEVAPEFGKVGMVTDLAWLNLDGDTAAELLVVGEWMPLTAFKLVGGKLKKMDAAPLGFADSDGLWNRLVTADLDSDGDLDLVTGNFGTNSRFTASAEKPLLCYANDFDKNGATDLIMAYFDGEKEFPLIQKDVMVKQIPMLKKRFIHARDYAKATIQDIFEEKDLQSGNQLRVAVLETCWWENQGGKFVRHKFPLPAQASPVFGIVAQDLNADGHADLLLAGNKYGIEVETGRCDASTGCVLLGDGKGGFKWMDSPQSGFWATGEVRDLAAIGSLFFVANNNGALQVFGK